MKKIPMRMCAACRTKKPKKELVRVVRTPEGEVLVDDTGRKNGRGVYLCRDNACLKKALKSHALERALEHEVGEETAAQLIKEFEAYGTEVQ